MRTFLLLTAIGLLSFNLALSQTNSFPASGNVGIGTTNPLTRLQVIGTSGGDGNWNQGILIENTNSTPGEPTLSFKNSSTGTSYWFTGLNQSINYDIAFGSEFTNANTFLRLTSTGNLGIGTVTPSNKLDVNGGITARAADAFRLRSSSYSLILRNDNSSFWALLTDQGNPDGGFNSLRPFSIGLSTGNIQMGHNVLFVQHGGNVGINTLSPSSRLTVVGSNVSGGIHVNDGSVTSASPSLRVTGRRNDDNMSSSFAGKIVLEGIRELGPVPVNKPLGTIIFGGNYNAEGTLAYSASINAVADGAWSSQSNAPAAIVFLTGQSGIASPDISNVSFGAERMRITSSGNVAIGTTNPQDKLHIKDGGDQYAGIRFKPTDGSNSNIVAGFRGKGLALAGGGSISSTYRSYIFLQDEYIQFSTRPGTTGTDGTVTERMRIMNNGDVAIGTTDPKGYKLAVAGKIVAEEVVVKLQGQWPDYVFSPNYNLRPLAEVERHINTHGHLPDVPNAQEVEENGIGLAEMNALLLKKMEELTLYVIEQSKRIEALENENQRLSKQ